MVEEKGKPDGAVVVREEFGVVETVKPSETAATAIAAREKAAVEARYIVAMKKPRDFEEVRVKLLKECSRPSFAEVARYNKPVGHGIVGPSIRFAEAALRCMTNILPEVSVVFEDAEKRILRVSVTDLESNLTYATEIALTKTVERKSLREGQVAISKRTNSAGQTTYLVAATEDDLLNKQNALISKAIRTSGLRLVPGGIIEECMEKVTETQRNRAAQDPDAEKHKIIDAFSQIGVPPVELVNYLGHGLEMVQPAEIVDLRSVYTAIRDGEASWAGVIEEKLKAKPPLEAPPAPHAEHEKETQGQPASGDAKTSAQYRKEASKMLIELCGTKEDAKKELERISEAVGLGKRATLDGMKPNELAVIHTFIKDLWDKAFRPPATAGV